MKNETKQHKVIILDKEYALMSDEPEEHLKAVAALVDETMRSILAAAPIIERQELAVLSSLQLASSFLATKRQLEVREQRENALLEWANMSTSAIE